MLSRIANDLYSKDLFFGNRRRVVPETSARNGYPGTRFNTRYPGTRQIPGCPGITQYPCYFFHKVRDTLFLSDNLNTTACAVDALHLHHKAGIQGWVPFIVPALLRVPAMSKRSVGFHLKSRCGDARRRACRTPNAAINENRSRH